MKTMTNGMHKLKSLGVLAVLVFLGVVVTTLAQAEDGAAQGNSHWAFLKGDTLGGYLGLAGGAADDPGARRRHPWLLRRTQTSFDRGTYSVYIGATDLGEIDDSPELSTGLELSIGLGSDLADDEGLLTERDPAFVSDLESTQYRLSGPLFSMSVGRRW